VREAFNNALASSSLLSSCAIANRHTRRGRCTAAAEFSLGAVSSQQLPLPGCMSPIAPSSCGGNSFFVRREASGGPGLDGCSTNTLRHCCANAYRRSIAQGTPSSVMLRRAVNFPMTNH
jgi:hypothetical protein